MAFVALASAGGKLPPCDASDYRARVSDDDLKFVAAIIDHEEGMNR
jgi:hypothetical protein